MKYLFVLAVMFSVYEFISMHFDATPSIIITIVLAFIVNTALELYDNWKHQVSVECPHYTLICKTCETKEDVEAAIVDFSENPDFCDFCGNRLEKIFHLKTIRKHDGL